MKKILILTEEFENSISPASFLNGYLSQFGFKVDEITISPESNIKNIEKIADTYHFIGLSTWGHDRKDLLELFHSLRKKGKITVAGGPGIIKENTIFTHTVAGAGEYFLKDLLESKRLPSFHKEEKYPSYNFKLTDHMVKRLTERDQQEISVSLKTFDGCYWGKCYFCTYNRNYPLTMKEFDEKKASIVAKTMNYISENIKNIKSNIDIIFYMSHASIGKKKLKNLLKAIKKFSKIDFSWVTFIRPDLWVCDYLEDLKKSKATLDIGYEFLSERDLVNKGISAENAVKLSLKAYKYGVPIKANFLYTIPGTEIKDFIECAINIARIRHTFSSFVMGQLFLEKETAYYQRSKEFDILCHDCIIECGRSDGENLYVPNFEAYSGFRTLKNYDLFIENNKIFTRAVSEIMETEIESWEDPFDCPVNLKPLDKKDAFNIIKKYFKNEGYIKTYTDYSWNIDF